MIKIKQSIAYHKACKKLEARPIEADPSIDLKPVIRKEKKAKQENISKDKDDDNVV